MARKQRGQVRTPGGPGPQQHSQPPRPQGGGSWGPLRDSVRRDIEQAAGALAFAAGLHDRLESQRRLFADFPRVMEQLRSGALERVATALARLFEGKEQFDLTRFLRDLPLALGQLAAAEAARKGAPREPASTEGAPGPAAAGDEGAGAAAAAPVETTAAADDGTAAEPGSISTSEGLPTPPSVPISTPPSVPISTPPSVPISTPPSVSLPPATADAISSSNAAAPSSNAAAPSSNAATPSSTPSQPPQPGNGGALAEPPSPRLELRSRLLAAAPQLGKAVVTYRRTVATVRRAAAPRRAPGPWRSDREVLEEARLAVDFARQLFDAYAEAWADQPSQPGSAEAMSAETDRFLAWTQLARYMDVAAPRSQPPPVEKAPDKPSNKQPVNEGSAGADGPPETETAHGV
jgi:hypothetical protein